MTYKFKTKPFKHQQECFDISKDEEMYAVLFEMGLGKSKVVVDNAAYLYSLGRINCLVIIAPNNVHKKWLNEDIPFSLPDHIETRCAVWEAGNKRSMEECEALLSPGECLRVFCANVEGLSHQKLPAFLKRLLLATDAFVVVDESTRIKNPAAKCSKNLMQLRRLTKYRRILAGDAVVNNPFDLFGQFSFLSEDILGHSFPAFKSEYCEMLQPGDPLLTAIMRKSNARHAPQIAAKNADGTVRYRNLDKLKNLIAPYSMSCKKAECLDLPPKTYEKRYFPLEKFQRQLYDMLAEKSRMELNDTTVPVLHKLTLLLRLQQVASGFVPDENGNIVDLFRGETTKNPRVATLLELLEEIGDQQVIIWCRFQEEIRMLSHLLGDKATTYYGADDPRTRVEHMDAFRSGSKQYLIGTAQAGGIGLNLTNSATAIYYSNSFNASHRWQSEDRCHRIGQTADSVLYVDLEAEDTIDSKIITALRSKKELSDYMLELGAAGKPLL